MRLLLFRHGIAIDRDDPAAPEEAERFLTGKGRRRARRAVQGLARLDAAPERILTSPWRRAVETAEILRDRFDLHGDALVRDEALLPDADPLRILHRVVELEEGEIALVGHAPHLDRVLEELTDGAPLAPLTKAGAACIEMESLVRPRGLLLWLLPNKALRRLGADA
jgi:phosphohistidine phosphatase